MQIEQFEQSMKTRREIKVTSTRTRNEIADKLY